jgi:hypothetical protein
LPDNIVNPLIKADLTGIGRTGHHDLKDKTEVGIFEIMGRWLEK